MSDREQAGFRGPVKICVEESISVDRPVVRTTTEYSPDGKLLETRSDHGNGFTLMFTHEYDSDGRLTKIKPANSDYPNSEMIYAYDDAGRSLSITNTANGDRTDFQYDEAGRKVGIQRFDPKTLERSRNRAHAISPWDAATSGAGVPLGGTILTIYDDEDRPIEMQTRDAGGEIMSRIVRTYNAAGLLIEEKPVLENAARRFLDGIPKQTLVTMPAGESHDGQDQPTEMQMDVLNKEVTALLSGRKEAGTWHTYDAQNRLTKVCERNFAFERARTIFYNDHGDTEEEHTTIAGNSVLPIGVPFSIGDDGTLIPSEPTPEGPMDPFGPPQRSEGRFTYRYDEQGNWTEQTANYGNSDARSGVRRRKLTYY
jgi:YD repeat-containing protein